MASNNMTVNGGAAANIEGIAPTQSGLSLGKEIQVKAQYEELLKTPAGRREPAIRAKHVQSGILPEGEQFATVKVQAGAVGAIGFNRVDEIYVPGGGLVEPARQPNFEAANYIYVRIGEETNMPKGLKPGLYGPFKLTTLEPRVEG
jgi:hypothetical protein